MRFNILVVSIVLIVMVSWVKLNHNAYPPPPEQYEVVSKTVNLKFKVVSKDLNSIEMALNQGQGPNNLFVLFDLSEKWSSGNLGLILKGMSDKATLSNKGGKKADISKFEKDNSGKKVEFYSFDQEIVKDNQGISYMKMIYTGPPMSLIESLKIEKNILLPRHLTARFVNNGKIEFLAGEYGLDKDIKGFWIPVKMS